MAGFTNLFEFGKTKIKEALSDDQRWKWMGVVELWHIVIEYWATWPPMFKSTPPFPDPFLGYVVGGEDQRQLTTYGNTNGWFVAYVLHPIKDLPRSLIVKAVCLPCGAHLAVGVSPKNTRLEVTVDLEPTNEFYAKSWPHYVESDRSGQIVRMTFDLSVNYLTIDSEMTHHSFGRYSRQTEIIKPIPNLKDCFICIATDMRGTIVELLSDT